MSKLFIFGIGGTGERVLRSFTMLLAAGVSSFDQQEIYPIILDYDAKNGDKKRTMNVLKAYQQVHSEAFNRHGMPTNQFFAAKMIQLKGLENFTFVFKPKEGQKKFKEHIGYSSLKGETLNTKKLLDTLYNNSSNANTELNLDMTVGFKGNPNIGSVVFNELKEKDEFNNFATSFSPTKGDRVVIIGSLFGGTGASGIPELVQAIRTEKPDAKLATILVVPYFSPAKEKDGTIDARRFNAKTKAAISYYQDSGLFDKISKVYFVGDPYPTVVPYCEGGEEQKNNANIVELIASIMIDHFLYFEGPERQFKFSIPVDIVINPKENIKSTRIFSSDFDDYTKEIILPKMKSLALALKFHKDEVSERTENAKDKDFAKLLDVYINEGESDETNKLLQKLKITLNIFRELFQNWLDELDYEGDGDVSPANSHRLALFDMKKSYADIVRKETTANVDTSSRLEKALRSFKQMFGGDKEINDFPDFIATRMNNYIDEYCDGNQLKHNTQKEFIYIDILKKATDDAAKCLND